MITMVSAWPHYLTNQSRKLAHHVDRTLVAADARQAIRAEHAERRRPEVPSTGRCREDYEEGAGRGFVRHAPAFSGGFPKSSCAPFCAGVSQVVAGRAVPDEHVEHHARRLGVAAHVAASRRAAEPAKPGGEPQKRPDKPLP